MSLENEYQGIHIKTPGPDYTKLIRELNELVNDDWRGNDIGLLQYWLEDILKKHNVYESK